MSVVAENQRDADDGGDYYHGSEGKEKGETEKTGVVFISERSGWE